MNKVVIFFITMIALVFMFTAYMSVNHNSKANVIMYDSKITGNQIEIQGHFNPYDCLNKDKFKATFHKRITPNIFKFALKATNKSIPIQYVVIFVTNKGFITQCAYVFKGELYFLVYLTNNKIMELFKYGEQDKEQGNRWDLIEKDFKFFFGFVRS